MFSPASDAIAQVEQALQNPTAHWSVDTQGLAPLIIESISAVYPSYNYSDLTNATSEVFKVLRETGGCLPTSSVLLASVPLSQLAKPNWFSAPEARKWQNLTRVGRKMFAGPLLLLSGASDSIIPYNDSISSSVLSTVKDTCSLMASEGWAESLELAGYEDMDHFPVIQASQGRWLQWVKDRLSPTVPTLPKGCSLEYMSGFRTQFMADSGPLPNFLVEWANGTDEWMYSL